MLDDAKSAGMDLASIANLREALTVSLPDAEPDTKVWPENWDIVQAFLSVSTQWRMGTVGGGMVPAMPLFIGLDYAAVRVALDALEIPVTPELWRGLRVMEIEAATALNERE